MTQRCLLCEDPDCDGRSCNGQQGHIEAQALPVLASGLTPDTYATSLAAADSVTEKDTQRELVYATIRAGHTDDEVQVLLDLDGSSERPRRWELWKQGRIDVLRDEHGAAIKRLTRTGRHAVVWVAVAHEA